MGHGETYRAKVYGCVKSLTRSFLTWRRKSKYPVKFTNLPQVTDFIASSQEENRTHNINGDTY
jgi:hypothetical protein